MRNVFGALSVLLISSAALLTACEDSGDKQDVVAGRCGDGICRAGEDRYTCPDDCARCGDGVCDTHIGERWSLCPQDCDPTCGDGECNGYETPYTCRQDCGEALASCGNGVCDPDETRLRCPRDCPISCGDGLCEGEENARNCDIDCGEEVNNHTVIIEPYCGDWICQYNESYETCPDDCEAPAVERPKLTMAQYDALGDEGKRVFLFDYTKSQKTSSSVKTSLDQFFSFPYPSDLRTDAKGHPSLKGYRLPKDFSSIILIGDIIKGVMDTAQNERVGFPPVSAVYMRSSVKVNPLDLPVPSQTRRQNSCVQLVNVEPDSPHYGERVPLYVTFHEGTSSDEEDYWAKNTLVLRPVPGLGPNPGDRYMAVVLKCLTAIDGDFEQSERLENILYDSAPDEITKHTSFYVDQLNRVGIRRDQVIAMAGYRTSDPADEMDQMEAILRDKVAKGEAGIMTTDDGLALGAWIPNYRSSGDTFMGYMTTCNFIEGTYDPKLLEKADYSNKGDGIIKFDDTGKLVSECRPELVAYQISVPDPDDPGMAMPKNGYPIAVYGHGTGGDSGDHVRFAPYGEGMSLIEEGVPMAMIGFDAVLQGARTKASSSTEADLYTMMIQNPILIRESVRQTVNDMIVIYESLSQHPLKLPAKYGSDIEVRFDPSYGLFMGHSQGSQEAGVLLGVTDKVHSAFLSAGGGGVTQAFVDLEFDLGKVNLGSGTLPFGTMSIADALSMIFSGKTGLLGYDSFLVHHIGQPVLDPIEPLNFAHRFIKEPPEGWGPKNIAQSIGIDDKSTPMQTQLTLAVAMGIPTVGKVFVKNDAMKLARLDESVSSPVSQNITNSDGLISTGGSMQFKYTKTGDNPHFVIYRVNDAFNAYINFFRSIVLDDVPTVSVSGTQETSEPNISGYY